MTPTAAIALLFFTATLSLTTSTTTTSLNNLPIVGIFTQPSDSNHEDCGGDCLMLAASYVKQVESTGARVVPLNYYSTTADIDDIFPSLNGFIFPGGGAILPPAAQYVYDLTVSANDRGDFMPLWGTCLGFEWLLMCTTRDPDVLDPKVGNFDSFNYSLPLAFTPHAENSKLFGAAPKPLMDILSTQNVTFNSHIEGIYPEHFLQNDALNSFYRILSTNEDRKGRPFVSTMEARNYPIFGVQWHPEKNRFENDMIDDKPFEDIPHSPDAVLVSQYMANFLASLTRQNFHKFPPHEEKARLIYNYRTSRTDPMFVETYFFANDFFLGGD